MRALTLIQAMALVLILSCVAARAQVPVKQYEVILYEGSPPEEYFGEARDNPKEKALLSMRVEEGEKFHAEGNSVMFEGKILSVKEARLELKIEKSRLGSTECSSISATVELGGALSPRSCAFSSIIFIYYFRVKSVNEKKDRLSMPLTAPLNNHCARPCAWGPR